MTYSHAKDQGQRSVGSKDRVNTNGHGRTEEIALRDSLMRSVKVNISVLKAISNAPVYSA